MEGVLIYKSSACGEQKKKASLVKHGNCGPGRSRRRQAARIFVKIPSTVDYNDGAISTDTPPSYCQSRPNPSPRAGRTCVAKSWSASKFPSLALIDMCA